MTRTERKILSPLIRKTIDGNRYLWDQLKREIWDLGYQSNYPAEYDFWKGVERLLSGLTIDEKSALVCEWNNARPTRRPLSESDFVSSYAALVIEEIVNRARIAADRTENW